MSATRSTTTERIITISILDNGVPLMDRELLKACSKGDLNLLRQLLLADPNILLSVTGQSNNCLHIAAMFGNDDFAMEVWSRAPSLFGTNVNGETPLILALMSGNRALASDMIRNNVFQHREIGFTEMLLKVDRNGDNALHHAIRNGFPDLALRLLSIEPRLSEQVNKMPESPMFMATRKRYTQVVEALLQISNSSHWGPNGSSVYFAAVLDHNPAMIKLLLERRPELADHKNEHGHTVIGRAVHIEDLDIVKLLLAHDPNLAYMTNEEDGNTAFHTAGHNGFEHIAEEIFRACPDSAFITNKSGQNALHLAVNSEYPHFVKYVLRTRQLHCFLNQADNSHKLPLHYAASQCNPELIRLLLSTKRHDYTAWDEDFSNAVSIVCKRTDLLKTVKWNESYTLLINALPTGWRKLGNFITKMEIKKQAIKEVEKLTERYTSNTSLVAALLATITFAAAFTLPGGYHIDPKDEDEGLPIFATNAAFQLFLIADTIAMSCSLAVAFLCVLATWHDLDFLLNYRKTTRALMWCAYAATSVAFGTGLFTVMAPKILWLAILILVLCSILPFISKIIGDWPLLKIHYRLGCSFRKELVPKI